MFNPSDLIGRAIGGQYRIEALIGRGSFGAVYRALDEQLDRQVAIKVIAHAAADLVADRFRREAQLQARLRHRAIVRLLHFGEDDGLFYMVQEYVEGQTLANVVRRQGPLTPERACNLFGVLLEALGEAHDEGVVHRDLKPANIMVVNGRRGEEPRLLDFGIAKIFEESDAIEALTASGMVIGTPAWMAPEQATRQAITPATDIYSTGCVLFYALTGQKVFAGTPVQVILDHVKTPPPRLPDHVPEALAQVVYRALAKAPADRFPSALAMADALAPGASITRQSPALVDTDPTLVTPEPHADETPLGISNISAHLDAEPQRAGIARWIGGIVALAVVGALAMWVSQGAEAPAEHRPTAAASAALSAGERPDARPSPRREHVDAGRVVASVDSARIAAIDASPPVQPDHQPERALEARRPASRRATLPASERPRPAKNESKTLDETLGRELSACRCGPARATVRRLRSLGVDREQKWSLACARAVSGQPSSTCAERLVARLERAMAECPCHDDATRAVVERLDAEFGVDRLGEWKARCVTPLPGSCLGP